MSAPSPTPTIFFLSLGREGFFDEQHARFLDALATRATVHRASKPGGALSYLQKNTPRAILLTDAALAKPKAAASPVLAAVRAYAQAGGLVILCCHFSSSVRPLDLNKFFRDVWGLPWESGSYHRTTVHLQQRVLALFRPALPQAYSQKAVFLKNVERKAALYLPDEYSHTESHVFPPTMIQDREQCPVVLAEVGEGWLAYIGDVNSEQETEAVIFAICGL